MRGKHGESKIQKGDGLQKGSEVHSEEIRSVDGFGGSDLGIFNTQGQEETRSGRSKSESLEGKRLAWSDMKHFVPTDFTCRCESMCDHKSRIAMEFVRKLDMLREQLGLPVTVNSGTRCEAYQTKVINGSPNSAHCPNGDGVSHAADVRVHDGKYLHKLLSLVFEIGFSGIGIGKGWLHLEDTTKPPQVWTYPPMRRK